MPGFFMNLLESTWVVIFSGSNKFAVVIFVFHELAHKIDPAEVFLESPGVKNILNYQICTVEYMFAPYYSLIYRKPNMDPYLG